ncbi:MAG TPA: NPCBM/NEW2 domain-containing protein [Streptomyces sp.]|nr:NPCBM/NEW2 domain-containing protein [Streptomyces sp.]
MGSGSVPPPWPEEEPPSDTELVSRTRAGDTSAYDELYRRHAGAVHRHARRCSRDADAANDLTEDVFAHMLRAVRDGGGPDTSVRIHLLSTVRRVGAVWGRTTDWERLNGDFAVFAVTAESSGSSGPSAAPDSPGSGDAFDCDADVRAMWQAERSTVVRAFRSLPGRWQVLLWHTAVEGESPREVAPLLGLTTDATAALVRRSREGLWQAFLQAHVTRSRAVGGDCARYTDRLETYTRGPLRARPGRGLRRHLERCADCRAVSLGIRGVSERLRVLLPVAVMGWGTATRSTDVVGAGAYAVGAGAAAGAIGSRTTARADGAAGSGTTVFEGMGATAKAGVTAGVMAASVATALTLALIGDSQRAWGPQPEAGTPPATASAPEAARANAAARGSEPQAMTPEVRRDQPDPLGERGRTERTDEVDDAADGAGSSSARPPASPSASARTPDEASGSPSAPGSVSDSAPDAVPPLPGATSKPAPKDSAPPQPAPTVHLLSQMSRSSSGEADRPTIRSRGSSWLWQRSQVRIDGRDRGHGVTVNAQSSVTIVLDRTCTAYDALVGVDDLTVGPGAVRFSVYGDGERLWRSGVIRRGDAPVPVQVPLSGRETLQLVVEPHSLLDVAALADWAQARISCR